ncbi:MAG: DUF4595 domain-containing protein [Muribaculaceae bacterium]|nr:DUF4595 domain-containing protein [Muribaculaceae bacterium]
MRKKLLFTLAVMFIAMMTLASCSKDEPVLKQSELLGEKTFGRDGDRLSFEYDANGKITGYTLTQSGREFRAILTEKDGVIYQGAYPFLYIKDGLATKMTYMTEGVSGVTEYSYEFSYNKGYLVGITRMVKGSSISYDISSTREYTLEYDRNHNLISVKQDVHEWKYTYGSLKNRNYYFLDNFPVFFDVAWQMGLLGKCTRNLPESMEMSIGACTYNFEYTIDEEGYVTNVKETQGNLPPASYIYKPVVK